MLEPLFNKGLLNKFIKKRLQHSYFPVKFPKYLRTRIFAEHVQWLVLYQKSMMEPFQHLTISTNIFIIDVWQGSKYASDIFQMKVWKKNLFHRVR